MVVNGIEYLDEDGELFPDGSVHDATLARDTVIQSLPCAGGRSVVFFPSGRLRLAWLCCPALVGDVACAPGIVYMHERGSLLNANLAAGHEFAGVQVPAGERVTLDEEGRLLEHSLRLEADQAVGGLPCSAAFHVWLYPSGRPSVVVLASPSTIAGRQYPRGTELILDETGEVLDWQPVDLDSGHRYKQRVFGGRAGSWAARRLFAEAALLPLLLKNLVFTLVVPGTVAGWVPWLMVRGQPVGSFGFLLASLVLFVGGGAIYLWCVRDFARFGFGTPALIDAPKRLVARGLYRYTRNPMYLGVLTVIAGWAVLYHTQALLLYVMCIAAGFHLFIVLYEEPHLRRKFGAEYEDYCTRAGRWVPVLTRRA